MATKTRADIAFYEVEIKTEPVDVETDCKETQQIGCDAKVKEEPVDEYSGGVVTEEVTEELYKDHIIKQEMVIGPVLLQQPSLPNNEDISEESTKASTKSKANKKPFTQKKYSTYVKNQSKEKQLDLDEHSRAGEISHQCKVCKRKFDKKSDLTRHKLIHTDVKPLCCKVCKRTFTFKGNLTRHEIVHSGAKPFGCDICQKKFSRKSYLITHIRFHAGDKPFRCEVCKKDFTLKSNLTKHVRSHTTDKTLCCKICQKTFSGKCYLTRHQRSHTGEQPYSCKVCQRKFSWKSSHMQHERSHT